MLKRLFRFLLLSIPSLMATACATFTSEKDMPGLEVSPDLPSFTLRPVRIDPLGADPATPWQVHMASLNVRHIPCLDESNILGRMHRGTEVNGTYLIVEETDEEWLEIEFGGQKAYVARLGFSRIHPRNQELIERHGNLPIGREIVNRWWGIPLDYEADDLVEIPSDYTRGEEGRSCRLRREAAESAMRMMDEMRSEGLDIFISSAYRSGATQRSVYNNRVRQLGLGQRRAAPPGHSEHQLGTTIDFSSTLGGRSLRNTDPQHAWLTAHGSAYGWRQTYTADNIEETGYIEEPWHWRYLGTASNE